ncbi:MAG TPA: hypothetical protein VGX03_36725 [Candidatus Binatia bacterium]|nr:hypothetical protein [Candidatus Binatia bacterium]
MATKERNDSVVDQERAVEAAQAAYLARCAPGYRTRRVRRSLTPSTGHWPSSRRGSDAAPTPRPAAQHGAEADPAPVALPGAAYLCSREASRGHAA